MTLLLAAVFTLLIWPVLLISAPRSFGKNHPPFAASELFYESDAWDALYGW